MVNEKTKKVLKWILIICAAITAAITTIMESGCQRKAYIKGAGIHVDSIQIEKNLKIK